MKKFSFCILLGIASFSLRGIASFSLRGGAEYVGNPPFAERSTVEFYVSPEGSDRNSGSVEAPFATLEAARDAIRKLRSAGGSVPGATVYLREGIYSLSRTFMLDQQDSGTAEAPVTYQAYPGEPVRLIGGRRLKVEQFSFVSDPAVRRRIIDPDAVDHIFEIDLKKLGITKLGEISRRGFLAGELSKTPPMELFVGGHPMQLARWPNDGTVQMKDILDPGPLKIPSSKEELPEKPNTILAEKNRVYATRIAHLTGGATEGRIPAPSLEWRSPELNERGGTFSYDYKRPEHWRTAEDIWVSGIFSFSWSWSYNRVRSIDPAAHTVTLAYGEMYGIQKNWFPDFHHYENLLEEIDRPGEYYIDRHSGRLYLYPPSGWNEDTKVFVSTADFPLIEFRNTSFVNIENLDLGIGRKGAVLISGGESIHLKHLLIQDVTGWAVRIQSGRDHSVESCRIHDIGSGGVYLGGGDWKTLTPGENRVLNCEIHDIGYFDAAYNPAIQFGSDSVGNLARCNRIYNTPHMAIQVPGNDHLIESNEIFDVCLAFSDMGAVYLNQGNRPAHRGTVIRGNFFHDIREKAVYPDNQTMGLMIEKNVFLNIPVAINSNSGAWIKVRDNLFVDVKTPLRHSYHAFGAYDFSDAWRKLFEKYDFSSMPHGKEYPELLTFFQEDRKRPDTNTFKDNILCNPNVTRSPSNGVEHPNPELLQVEGNVILRDENNLIRVCGGKLSIPDPEALAGKISGFPLIQLESFESYNKPVAP